VPSLPLRLAPALDRHPVLRTLLAGRRPWKGLVVLAHHRVGDAADAVGDPSLFAVDEAGLDEQLAVLTRNADVIDPEGVTEVRRKRGRHVLLTFDDGYADASTAALPILRAHDVRAAFFVASGFVDHPRLPWWDELRWMAGKSGRGERANAWTEHYKRLPSEAAERYLEELAVRTGVGRAPRAVAREEWCTWDDVRALRRAGMAIGAHTHDHPILARASAERQREELRHGMDRIEAETGDRPTWLAYPVGQRDSFTATTRRIAAEEGIDLAFSSYGGWNPGGRIDPYDVRRIWVPADPARLRARVLAPRCFT
jgi:peptidoglycan/xylan/chitin deacetylase (PgdA/CDA1 family)